MLDKTFHLYRQIEVNNYGQLLWAIAKKGQCGYLKHDVIRNVIEVDGWILHKLDVHDNINIRDWTITLDLNISNTEWWPFAKAKSACEKIVTLLKVCCYFTINF